MPTDKKKKKIIIEKCNQLYSVWMLALSGMGGGCGTNDAGCSGCRANINTFVTKSVYLELPSVDQQVWSNNNNNNRIQRRYSTFFTISSQRREPSPTRTLKWPGRNRVQITCNTSSAYRVQVSCYVPLGTKGQLSY